MAKILVVEDEPGIAFGLETDLQAEGYEVTVAGDGVEAIRRTGAEAFDLILLDVMLPHKDGFEVCRELRQTGVSTPIVMLTAKGAEFDKVLGLDLGADDYITKPFSPRELRARIRAALRHQPGQPANPDLQRQLRVATEVQQRFFPKHRPVLATLDYAAFCQPALGMSGDYYDFLDLGNGRLGLLVADVVGKGVPAALLMASIHASVRTRARLFQDRCGELLSHLNELLYESTDPGMFATVFYAVYDESSRVLTYANAGHEPPILLRNPRKTAAVSNVPREEPASSFADSGRASAAFALLGAAGSESVLRLESHTPPAGVCQSIPALQSAAQLDPGDWLLIFTDGITETRNTDDEEFGTDRLLAAMNGSRDRSAEDILNQILAALSNHSRGLPQSDDVTLIAAHVLQAQAANA
jgi:serine phosphatase RsbU (regulator of sigma subunit)